LGQGIPGILRLRFTLVAEPPQEASIGKEISLS
jgi:hypothetical protein